MKNKQQNWEEEFNKKFPQFENYEFAFRDCETNRLEIKSFISNLLQSERKRIWNEFETKNPHWKKGLPTHQQLLSELPRILSDTDLSDEAVVRRPFSSLKYRDAIVFEDIKKIINN